MIKRLLISILAGALFMGVVYNEILRSGPWAGISAGFGILSGLLVFFILNNLKQRR